MRQVENRWRHSTTRRKALAALAGMVAGSPLLLAQQDPHGSLRGHQRVPGIDEMETVFDFEPICFANVPLSLFDYTAHGDGSEFTLRRNRTAFEWVDVVPGKAIDPASVNLASELFGTRMAFPIMIAPSSNHRHMHPDAEVGTYKGATAAGTTMVVASGPSLPHETIVAGAAGPRWTQYYPQQDLGLARETLTRFQSLGPRAIVVTVDQQASEYERDAHDRNLGGAPRPRAPQGGGRGGTPAQPNPYRLSYGRQWYSWPYLDSLRKFITLPMLVKGIVTAEDAELCIQHGMDGIIVSNHGGRSMDYGPSTLEVLPDIVAAVRGRVPVLVDSGFRRGSDVFKALALGARAVCLGRATRWGLGAFGAPGVQRVLEIMQAELVQTAARAGRSTLTSIDGTAVKANFL
jgi:isopentenyl diphosphate isomerase/L-lactate dehydrogenase-like FMN-dependent dehydrogenase